MFFFSCQPNDHLVDTYMSCCRLLIFSFSFLGLKQTMEKKKRFFFTVIAQTNLTQSCLVSFCWAIDNFTQNFLLLVTATLCGKQTIIDRYLTWSEIAIQQRVVSCKIKYHFSSSSCFYFETCKKYDWKHFWFNRETNRSNFRYKTKNGGWPRYTKACMQK